MACVTSLHKIGLTVQKGSSSGWMEQLLHAPPLSALAETAAKEWGWKSGTL